MAISENYVTESQVKSTGYATITPTSAFSLARFGVRLCKSRGLIWEDSFVVLSWLSFLAMSILYIIVITAGYRASGVLSGTSLPYATMEKDGLSMKKIFFATTILLWTLKVAQIGAHANRNSTPSSSRLAFWGILEAGIAVIVGCLPALAIIFRQDRLTRRTYGLAYTSMEGYSNQNSIPLSAISNGTNKPLRQHGIYVSPPTPSVSKLKGIAVTQSVLVSCLSDPMDYFPKTPLARPAKTMLTFRCTRNICLLDHLVGLIDSSRGIGDGFSGSNGLEGMI
ncbi:hypothetical protein FQN53_003243 [Emmonsiellopsis sp. PD_33]|nr:hypothetical protein FQN53_003243 [Emmonsiellopsis sp. PD_33]